MREPFMVIQDLVVSYGSDAAVRGVSLTVERGTLVGLIGPNGAGKTSFLLSISGQFSPQGGHVQWCGKDVYLENLVYKHKIGYVHEEPFFYPYLTAEDFMRFIAGVKRVPSGEREGQIQSLMTLVGLWEERTKLTSSLSMGMRKKLAIAAAMVGAPEVLFLDEALNGIDLESSYRIKQALRDFVSSGGSVVLSTHTLEVVEKMCDRYILLKGGRVVADLKAEEVAEQIARRDGSLERYVIELLSDSERA